MWRSHEVNRMKGVGAEINRRDSDFPATADYLGLVCSMRLVKQVALWLSTTIFSFFTPPLLGLLCTCKAGVDSPLLYEFVPC